MDQAHGGQGMTEDPNGPPAWQAVDQLLDDIVPWNTQGPSRWELDDAITKLVIEAEELAVKAHGQQMLHVMFGDHFQQVREELDQWTTTD